MSMTSIGDLARGFGLSQRSTDLRRQIETLSTEMVTGHTADIASHLAGNYTALGGIERSMRALDGYRLATGEAAARTSAMQQALGRTQDVAADLGNALLLADAASVSIGLDQLGEQAGRALHSAVSAMNVSVAGQSLFAGAATDGPALAPADTMLSHLRGATAGMDAAPDILAAVDAWFHAAGGGFETDGYLGAGDAPPVQLRDGEIMPLDFRADGLAMRSVLRNMAVAALATDPGLGLTDAGRTQLMQEAASGLRSSGDALTATRARLGAAEDAIEQVATRNASERTSLDLAKSALLGVDPYQTATQLEDARFQLESIYAVTARMSRLSLLEYLR